MNMKVPFRRTWTYVLDGVPLDIPSDLPEEAFSRPVNFGSTAEVFAHAIRVYVRYFPTIAALFLIPMVIGELLLKLAPLQGQTEWRFAIRWIFTVVAFAPLVNAVADVCAGNRPGLRRSYARVTPRTFIAVSAGSAIATLLIFSPFILLYQGADRLFRMGSMINELVGLAVAIAGGVAAALFALRMLIWFLYVPVIVVMEPHVSLPRAAGRSRWLGLGYFLRTGAVAVVIFLIFTLSGVIRATTAEDLGFLGVLLSRLVEPVPFIAATLIYYDLRARKEGYGVVERTEDLH